MATTSMGYFSGAGIRVVSHISPWFASFRTYSVSSKDWFGIHEPAFDVIDLASALKLKMEGLAPRQRKDLADVLLRMSLAADRLDKAGDASDAGRVLKYLADFESTLDDLHRIY